MPSNAYPVLFAGQSQAASATSSKTDLSALATISYAVVWTGGTARNGVVKIQESLDGVTWIDITGATATLSGATGSKKLGPYTVDLPYHQAVLTKTTETTGTVDCKAFARAFG